MKKLFPVLSLLTICVVMTGLLAFVYGITKEPIEKQLNTKFDKSCQELMQDASHFTLISENIYSATNENDDLIGYIFITITPGYREEIKVMTGILTNGSVSGVSVLESNETPGLGKNCEEPWFENRFITDKKVSEFVVNGNNLKNDKVSVDAITGATISSSAVTSAVNEAIVLFNNLK